MKNRYIVVDFLKEANPETPASERVGFNDPIKFPNVNLHPTNYGIYKANEPTALVCYIPTHHNDELGVARHIVDALEFSSNEAVYEEQA
jgi:hypothetical protein